MLGSKNGFPTAAPKRPIKERATEIEKDALEDEVNGKDGSHVNGLDGESHGVGSASIEVNGNQETATSSPMSTD